MDVQLICKAISFPDSTFPLVPDHKSKENSFMFFSSPCEREPENEDWVHHSHHSR